MTEPEIREWLRKRLLERAGIAEDRFEFGSSPSVEELYHTEWGSDFEEKMREGW
jgi:hypothetical protein